MIRISDLVLGKEERDALNRVIDRAWINEGSETRAFEEEYASFLGVDHCIAVSSGTAALMVGLTAMKIDPRYDIHTVLLPALTFISTANAVTLCSLTPVFGDVRPDTFTLDPASYRKAYDLALPVHLFGYPAAMDYPLFVEDACEAHGSTIDGRQLGSFGLWSATSFHVAHTLQAGELGLVCTNDDSLARMVHRLKAHGRICACEVCTRNTTGCPIIDAKGADPRFRFLYPGFNFKPMEFPAAIARVQLRKLKDNIERRLSIVYRMNQALSVASDLLQLPVFSEDVAYMAYPIVLCREGIRDAFTRDLLARGVDNRPLFHCIPTQQPAYAHLAKTVRVPNADYAGLNGFYVGCHQYLTDDEVEELISTLLTVAKEFQ